MVLDRAPNGDMPYISGPWFDDGRDELGPGGGGGGKLDWYPIDGDSPCWTKDGGLEREEEYL